MRLTLGENEKERVVRRYMKEMGEQWKGAGVGFDYALARGQEGLPELGSGTGTGSAVETSGGDGELAAWVWRNLFAARGSEEVDFGMDGGDAADSEPSSLSTPSTNPSPSTASTPTSTPTSTSTRSRDPSLRLLKIADNLRLIVSFIRREVHRLEGLKDEDVEQGRIREFGSVRGAGAGAGASTGVMEPLETVDGA